jgi:hypothetical protein
MPPHATLCSSSRVPACSCSSVSCSSSRVPAVVFQQSCSSSRVPAFVFQHLRLSICDSALVFQHLRFGICDSAFVFQHLRFSICDSASVLCFSNCDSAIVFQLLCSNTCACSITNRLSSMTTLTICVSFCVPAFCVSICVSASVISFVLPHLCCSICVSASVFLPLFSINNRLPSMTTLIICIISVVAIFPTPQPYTIGWLHQGSDLCIKQQCQLSYDIKPFKVKVLCDISPLKVCDVLLGQPYLWKHHVVYESRPRSVIITLNRNLYRILEVVPPSVISLVSTKKCRKVISWIGKFFFFMIRSQNE